MHTKSMLAIAAVAAAGGGVHAEVVPFTGWVEESTEMTGATFSGTADYSFAGGDTGSLVLSIMNDTPADVSGFLTGLVFNIGSSDAAAMAELVGASDPDFLDTGEENAAPFGMFDAGAALNANWQGGGNPSGGIAVGDMETFEFLVTASDASSLTALDFLGGGTEIGMVVRFGGLADGGSDKVPNFVPAPGAAALLGLGGLVAMRRRR